MRRLAPIGPLKRGGKTQTDLLASPDESFDAANQRKSKNSRTAHACESCRFLKVRCLLDINSSIQKCQRCAKLNQECLIKPRGPRKPRKRTDTKVVELERKVEALKAVITESFLPSGPVWPTTYSDGRSTLTDDQERALVLEAGALVDASPTSLQGNSSNPLPRSIIRGTFPQHTDLSQASLSPHLLTPSIATNLFNKHEDEVMGHFPLTLLSEAEDASMVREKWPTLFLAVITAASGACDLELHSTLNHQLEQDFARRVDADGEKCIELVQALLVAAAFYHPPDPFEKLKYHQYIHMAWTMTADLGLRNSGGPATPGGIQEFPFEYGENEMESNVSRRTLIASYMSCLSVGRSLRRASMIQSENAPEQSIEALEKSCYATRRDHRLIAWVRLEIIMKEVTRFLGLSDSDSSPADVADLRTQSTIKALERCLESWKEGLSPGVMHPSLEITYHYSKMYLHEIAFHHSGNCEEFHPPFRLRAPSSTAYNLPDLQTARLDCVITSMTSAHCLIEVLLRLTPQSLCVFPTGLYIRASYAIFMLLRIFLISSAPGSELGRILDPASVKIGYYLNRLVSHMQVATSGGSCRLTTRFYGIFSRSRDWFRKQALRTDWENAAGDEDVFEPFRLLTLNADVEVPQCPVQVEQSDAHQLTTARVPNLHSDMGKSTERFDMNWNRWSIAAESNQLDQGGLDSGTATWQYPTPWVSQNVPLDVVQAEFGISEAQLGTLHPDDQLQIPSGQVDNIIDDSFDLALGFDFDSHFWDFDMGNAIFEQT